MGLAQEWARTRGIALSDRGRIPRDVVRRYLAETNDLAEANNLAEANDLAEGSNA